MYKGIWYSIDPQSFVELQEDVVNYWMSVHGFLEVSEIKVDLMKELEEMKEEIAEKVEEVKEEVKAKVKEVKKVVKKNKK